MSFFRITPSRHSVSILGLNALFTIFSLVIFSFCVNYKLARLHLISDTMLSFTDLMYCNIYLLALLFKKKIKTLLYIQEALRAESITFSIVMGVTIVLNDTGQSLHYIC